MAATLPGWPARYSAARPDHGSLLSAADAIGAGSARVAVVVVSDALVPGNGTPFEARAGAGAAAVERRQRPPPPHRRAPARPGSTR